jgi:hypothetical protein
VDSIARVAGVVYLAYFLTAGAGQALSNVPLKVIATAVYFGLVVLLFALFRAADPRVAPLVLPLAALGCVIQSVAFIEADRPLERLGVAFFGLYMVVLGYLVARSQTAPVALGGWLAVAGLSASALLIAGLPVAVAALILVFAGGSELALVVWLLFFA